MTEAPRSSIAPRQRRHVDARLLVGLILVAASIAAVVGIVAASDEGEDVLVASRLLTAGQMLTVDDLEVRRVALGIEGHGYLTPDDMPTDGVVVTRTVGAGELVPLASVGDTRGSSATTLVVSLSTALGATVRPGDSLDLWSAPALDAGRFGAHEHGFGGDHCRRTVADEGIVAAREAGRVELLIARRDVARILYALANGDALSAIPASLSIGR